MLVAVVLGLAYAIENPLHPSEIEPPGHTHAFDIYCRPFEARSTPTLAPLALVKVDDRISDGEAACLQSLSDSVAAVETARLGVGDTVVILGQGSMGLECLQISRLCGAGMLITVDVRVEACDVSRSLGPTMR